MVSYETNAIVCRLVNLPKYYKLITELDFGNKPESGKYRVLSRIIIGSLLNIQLKVRRLAAVSDTVELETLVCAILICFINISKKGLGSVVDGIYDC